MKHTTTMPTSSAASTIKGDRLTAALDLSDTYSSLCLLDSAGALVEESRVRTTESDLTRRFAAIPPCRVILEVGTHSPWVSRLLTRLGHDVVVANPRRVRLIAESVRKHDRADAEELARLGRADPALLSPIHHRSQQAQEDLAVVRSRDGLVRTRTLLINQVRGTVKAHGERLPGCSAGAFPAKVAASIPLGLQPALLPLLDQIAQATWQIRAMDRAVEVIAGRYPEAALLRRVPGVGSLTALTFVLVIEDPSRFRRSREVGPFLGLTPRLRHSGARAPQLGITKAGDDLLRRLLVSCAHYILGPFGPDCDLRRWGLRHAPPGAKNAKHRTIVAVARRLAVLLHHLWVSGEVYEPLYHQPAAAPLP